MKKITRISIVLSFLLILVVSCKKDDDFHSIKAIEREIHTKINAYRSSQGLNTLVEQFLIFREARSVSDKMANGSYDVGDPAIQDVINEFTANLGGNGNGWITMASGYENADSIVNAMLSDPASVQIIKMDYTQSGVGVSEGLDGLFYVCHMFINIPDK